MRSSPPPGRSVPARIFSSVDLPAPFSPTIAWAVPAAIEKETSRSAVTAPNDFDRWWNSTAGKASPFVAAGRMSVEPGAAREHGAGERLRRAFRRRQRDGGRGDVEIAEI